jgi:uncharacterized membrane protein
MENHLQGWQNMEADMGQATGIHALEHRSAGAMGIQPVPLALLFAGALAGMTALVFLVVEAPLLLGLDPDWTERVEPYALVLHVHAVCGVFALFSGPLQFVPWVRERHPILHRALGYGYVAAVAIAGPLAVWIAVNHTAPSESLASSAQGVVWLLTTAAALVAVRSHDIRTHRLWMARSYALTFTFVLHRFIVELLGLRLSTDAGGTAAFVWLLTVAVVLIADAIVAFYKPANPPLPMPA